MHALHMTKPTYSRFRVPSAAEKLSFRTVLTPSGASAILSPATNVMTYLLTYGMTLTGADVRVQRR